ALPHRAAPRRRGGAGRGRPRRPGVVRGGARLRSRLGTGAVGGRCRRRRSGLAAGALPLPGPAERRRGPGGRPGPAVVGRGVHPRPPHALDRAARRARQPCREAPLHGLHRPQTPGRGDPAGAGRRGEGPDPARRRPGRGRGRLGPPGACRGGRASLHHLRGRRPL
ncbi:MAG: hypothetical protein AVDCRST_MAG76-1763, partial [uncultured Acidimicrobiales bacterium]